MGFPAARLTDMHVCPMVTVIVPHVGGPITAPGSPVTLIGMLPAARVGDIVTCVGPPDVIVMGSTTVLIGGQPAARMTSQCAHGGMVILGCFTVLVGDAGSGSGGGGSGGAGAGGAGGGAAQGAGTTPMAQELARISNGTSPTITVTGSDAFKTKTLVALSRILATPSGQAWLTQMQANGKSVTIQEGAAGQNDCTPANGTNAGNGTGTNSTINWDPNTTSLNGYSPEVGNCGSDTILFHEMCHGLHNGNGTHANGPNESFGQGGGGSSQRGEERQTVGTGPSVQQPPNPDGTPNTRPIQQEAPPGGNAPPGQQTNLNGTPPGPNYPTENSYRRDQGVPERPSYFPTNWPGGAPW